MDIGGKMCSIHFLNNNKITFDFILMLQSKSNIVKRKRFFDPIVYQLDKIISYLTSDIGVICPIDVVQEGIIGYSHSDLRTT